MLSFYTKWSRNLRRTISKSAKTTQTTEEVLEEPVQPPVAKKKVPQTKPYERKISISTRKSHSIKINDFLRAEPHLSEIKKHLPLKYLQLKRVTPPDNLYLIDEIVAKRVAQIVLTRIRSNQNQVVSETNAGLGLISRELLENGVKLRIYESCPDYKVLLKERLVDYLGQYDLFTKDIFLIYRYDFMDKQDNGNRVEQLLSNIPNKLWEDEPAITIVGTMSNMNFIRYMIKSLVLQKALIEFGRTQLFTFIRPRDFTASVNLKVTSLIKCNVAKFFDVLTAGPELDLHTYQPWSVMFNLLFDVELIEKFPRNIFLPWESEKIFTKGRYPSRVDPDLMYFVRINYKKQLPLTQEHLLPFYAFVFQFFKRGNTRIIPIAEKWFSGIGLDILVPKFSHQGYYPNMDIYTKFGELTPQQILYVFEEMVSNPDFAKSPFMAMVESQLLKYETIETGLDEQLEKNIEDIIEKIDK